VSTKKYDVIVVESQISARKDLVDLVKHADIADQIVEASSVADACKAVLSRNFGLCLVGNGLTRETQKNFIRSIASAEQVKYCAIIALTPSPDKETVMDFVEAGAHGVLMTPPNLHSIRKVANVAFHGISAERGKGDSGEQVTSLPWLLETVAEKLNELAICLEEEEQKGRKICASPKMLQEVVLRALAVSGDDDPSYPEDLLQELLKQR